MSPARLAQGHLAGLARSPHPPVGTARDAPPTQTTTTSIANPVTMASTAAFPSKFHTYICLHIILFWGYRHLLVSLGSCYYLQ